jgi:hypothetical protein
MGVSRKFPGEEYDPFIEGENHDDSERRITGRRTVCDDRRISLGLSWIIAAGLLLSNVYLWKRLNDEIIPNAVFCK